MTNDPTTMNPTWIPAACTLPTAERPTRRAEFDALFAMDVLSVDQVSPREVRLELRPEAEAAARAADLAVKETGCCSFFAFGLTISDGTTLMTISAEQQHEAVLAALSARAGALVGSGT
jgi:hypothetical protein